MQSDRDFMCAAMRERDNLAVRIAAIDRLLDSYAGRRPAPKKRRREGLAKLLSDAEAIIVESGHPMTRGELTRRLEAKGYVLPGVNKMQVLGTNLWRSGRFWQLKGLGYWPKAAQAPDDATFVAALNEPAGYVGEDG